MSEYGTVVNVAVVTLGAITSADAASAATTIAVEDNVDLHPGSGLVITDADGALFGTNQVASLAGEDTVVLAMPLASALAAGARLDLYPAQRESRASVRLASGGEPIRCTVRHDLADTFALVEGVRDETNAETVLVEKVGDDYQIVEVTASPTLRRIIGGYIATIDDEETQRIVIRDDGNGGILESFSGLEDETPGGLDPSTFSGQPQIKLSAGLTPTYDGESKLELRAGSTGTDGTATLSAQIVNLTSYAGFTFTAVGGGPLHVVDAVIEADAGVDVNGGAVLVTTGGHVLANGAVKAQDAVYSPTLPGGSSGGAVIMRASDGRLQIDTSSQRFKDDVQPADEAAVTAALTQVETKTYLRIDAEPGREAVRELGILVEDLVAAGLDQLVIRDLDDKPYAVNQGSLLAALIATARVQQKTIDALDGRISALEAGQ